MLSQADKGEVLEIAQGDTRKPRLLPVFKIVAATAIYCGRNAGRLFILIWFPCLLVLACQITLDWLALGYPPRLPDWTLSGYFNPPTWLTAVAITPWGAMAWAFVLSDMAERNADRGLVTARLLRPARLRFELSGAVVLVAAIFAAVNLLDGVVRLVQFELLTAAYTAFDMSDAGVDIWDKVFDAIRIALLSAVTAWSYLVAGDVLRTGTFDIAHIWKVTRGNRLRLFAVFLLLSLAVIALDRLAAPAVAWLTQSAEVFWTLQGALIRHLTDLPFFMLWTVAYAVTVGIVLDVLERRQPPV